jgi:hypothetical protein
MGIAERVVNHAELHLHALMRKERLWGLTAIGILLNALALLWVLYFVSEEFF